MKDCRTILAAAVAILASKAVIADITIGVSLPLSGPASGLGIPMKNQIALWPQSIAGEKLKFIVLDDATDPTNGVKNARRFATEDKVDLIVGSAATPVGFLGYTDAYGEGWLKDFTPIAEKAGIKVIAAERFARTDTGVTGQALKLVAANPDAMLIVASGSGAAMPEMAIVERGFKGKIYQTHAAATRDLMRIGGKSVEGTYVVSGPLIAPEQLPDSHPSKKLALDFAQKYDKAYGVGSRNQFAGHAYDAIVVMEKAFPLALKKAKPGTREFRLALRDAFETMGRTVFAHGVMNWTKDDHWGYTNETGVIVKVVNGDWKMK
jgi:branched-chain amino acid transport system substrate-binding protein